MSSVGSPYATGLSCLLLGACALHTNSLGPVVTPAGFTDPDLGIGRSLAETRANIAELFELWQDGKISPQVSETYSLDDAHKAIEKLENRQAVGKLVVKMDK